MSSSNERQQDILAQNVGDLIAGGKWMEVEVTQDDWHFAEELLIDMALLDEAGAHERAIAGLERLAQQYERWLSFTGRHGLLPIVLQVQ